jgi:phage shock protein C
MKVMEPKRLFRSRKDRILGGVCGGLGNYLNVDPVLVRVVWAILFFAAGVGFLAYILAWIIIPEEVIM